MPVYAVYIEKRATYFGTDAVFGNTYHYLVSDPPTDWEDFANNIAAEERNVTRSEVEFIGYSVWGPTDGSEFDNVIVDSGSWSFFGAITLQDQYMYREVCALAIWRLPRSQATNRRRWLRKFWRSAPGDASISGDALEGSAPIDSSALAALEAAATNLVNPTAADGTSGQLCTADGDLPTDSGGVRPYFYTRQIGQ